MHHLRSTAASRAKAGRALRYDQAAGWRCRRWELVVLTFPIGYRNGEYHQRLQDLLGDCIRCMELEVRPLFRHNTAVATVRNGMRAFMGASVELDSFLRPLYGMELYSSREHADAPTTRQDTVAAANCRCLWDIDIGYRF